MELVGAVALAIAGAWFIILYRMSVDGKLPVNHVSGLRTRAIMSSSNAWIATHKKFAKIFLVDGLCFILCAAILGICGMTHHSIKSHDFISMTVMSVMVVAVLMTIMVGFKANSFAKNIGEKS